MNSQFLRIQTTNTKQNALPESPHHSHPCWLAKKQPVTKGQVEDLCFISLFRGLCTTYNWQTLIYLQKLNCKSVWECHFELSKFCFLVRYLQRLSKATSSLPHQSFFFLRIIYLLRLFFSPYVLEKNVHCIPVECSDPIEPVCISCKMHHQFMFH